MGERTWRDGARMEDMAMATCDACGAAVRIGWTVDGHAVVLDPDEHDEGSYLLAGSVAVGFVVKDILGDRGPGIGGAWLRPHRATCAARQSSGTQVAPTPGPRQSLPQAG